MPQARLILRSGMLTSHFPQPAVSYRSVYQTNEGGSNEPTVPGFDDAELFVPNINSNGSVIAIEVAEYYQRPDLSPITIFEVHGSHLTLKFKDPVELRPFKDDSEELVCVEEPDLGIEAFARTRAGLVYEIHEQLLMLWQEYALEDDEHLSQPAIELKRNLQSRLEVAQGA